MEIIQWGWGEWVIDLQKGIRNVKLKLFFKEDFLKCSSYRNTPCIWFKSYDQQAAENLCLLLIMDATEQKFPLQDFTPE